jgi:hypothetical protein
MKIRSLEFTQCLAPLIVAGTLLSTGCSTTTKDVSASDKPAVAQGDKGAMQLPPGWTEADMQACTLAGQPGKMHEWLMKGAGSWKGKNTMWMAPGMAPMESDVTCTTTAEMDGRWAKVDYTGEMPAGMGSFHGIGYNGYDNVSKKFVGVWMDNHSSGMMVGEGSLGADGKTLTWNFRYNDPITKMPAVMRQIERHTSDDAMTLEMFGNDPKSGREYKMMQIELKKAGT